MRFHPDVVPDWVAEVEETADGMTRTYRGLDTPASVHQVRWDFTGMLSLEWGYGVPDAEQ